MRLNKILLLLLFLAFVSPVWATNYYVDASIGSDSNPGTEAQPWLTMIYGVAQLSAGDTLYAKNGTYASRVLTGHDPGIAPVNSGTAGNPITIMAYPGHHPIIDGTTAMATYPPDYPTHQCSDGGPSQRTWATIGVNNKNYITFDGFTIYKGLFLIYGPEDGINFVHDIIIRNCVFQYGANCYGDCSYSTMIDLVLAQYVTIQNCLFYGLKDTAPDIGGNRDAVIFQWSNDCVVEKCTFYDNVIHFHNKDGNYNSGPPYQGYRNKVRYNIFKAATTNTAIWMGDYDYADQNNEIYQNVFIGTGARVSFLKGNLSALTYNNTFYNTDGGVAYGDNLSGDTGHQVYNNIFHTTTYPMSTSVTDTWPSGIFVDYNCYYNHRGFFDNYATLTFAQFKAQVGNNNYVVNGSDPLFVDPTNVPTGFKLQDSSPCKGTGKNGVNMGAYITGHEIIGAVPTGPGAPNPPAIPPAPSAPNPPTNLKIFQ